jgi:hypothetical protein
VATHGGSCCSDPTWWLCGRVLCSVRCCCGRCFVVLGGQ